MLPPLTGPARSSLTELGALVVPEYRDRLWWYHKQIAEALEGLLRYVRFKGEKGGYARVAISMPPQHGKSLHGTELFPALALGQDPDILEAFLKAGAEAGILRKLHQDGTKEYYALNATAAVLFSATAAAELPEVMVGATSSTLLMTSVTSWLLLLPATSVATTVKR
jgi:hypothetical protein